MIKAHFSREKIYDRALTHECGVESWTLGPLRAYIHVRIPLFIAKWLADRAAVREARIELLREVDYLRAKGEITAEQAEALLHKAEKP